MANNISAFGLYPDRDTVEDAIETLKAEGFRATDISVLYPDNNGSKDLIHQKHTKAPEGAVTGGGIGAAVGAGIGWLIGAGAIGAIAGLEPMVAAGPILGMLSGMGVGVLTGGLAGGLVGMGMPEYEAKRFEGRVRRGGILLSVHCDNSDWSRKAIRLLKKTGATDVSATHEARADFMRTDKPRARSRYSKA
ncbi:MAG TPA: quinol:electron acceptor oxidoreductase subunit ActD [Bryobacteraceae bacterium]|jgi:hypothetical protein|nr:quinol:electron acceptor oxidoreductase subunit ActD [Bryobacteraceae bacterium]